jgi:hypothetical protein
MNQNNCHYNDNMKAAAKPTLKISSVSNITQPTNNVQYNCGLIREIKAKASRGPVCTNSNNKIRNYYFIRWCHWYVVTKLTMCLINNYTMNVYGGVDV